MKVKKKKKKPLIHASCNIWQPKLVISFKNVQHNINKHLKIIEKKKWAKH